MCRLCLPRDLESQQDRDNYDLQMFLRHLRSRRRLHRSPKCLNIDNEAFTILFKSYKTYLDTLNPHPFPNSRCPLHRERIAAYNTGLPEPDWVPRLPTGACPAPTPAEREEDEKESKRERRELEARAVRAARDMARKLEEESERKGGKGKQGGNQREKEREKESEKEKKQEREREKEREKEKEKEAKKGKNEKERKREREERKKEKEREKEKRMAKVRELQAEIARREKEKKEREEREEKVAARKRGWDEVDGEGDNGVSKAREVTRLQGLLDKFMAECGAKWAEKERVQKEP